MGNDQIEEIKSKVDIVSVIGESVDLKKAGRNYKAPCPFHNEKFASFVVSPELQIYKCFGCGAAGDVFNFLKEYEGLDFAESLKRLAERAGVKLKPMVGGKSDRHKLLEINDLVAKFYHYVLLKHPSGKAALQYLVRDRGLKKETINEFSIGFSPKDTSIFTKYIIGKKKIDTRSLDKLGITYPRGSEHIDRFKGRVIFPLTDQKSDVLGFAGRILPQWEDPNVGKYINSPETPLYHKSSMLFGLDKARKDIKRQKTVIFVEGELDMISLWQAGIKNVVAIKGTAITKEQAVLTKRYAEKIILALDADIAGDAAARRGIGIAEEAGLEVRVAVMKDFKDPDEAVRKDLNGFKKVLENAQPVWDFLIDSAIGRYGLDTGEAKAKVSREVVPVLSVIDDKIVQAHYVGIVARKLGVPPEAVLKQVESVKVQKDKERTILPQMLAKNEETKRSRRELVEKEILNLAFNSEPQKYLNEDLFKFFETRLHTKILDQFAKIDKFELGQFANSLPKELYPEFSNIILQSSDEEPVNVEKEIGTLIKELKIIDTKEKLEQVAEKITRFEEKKDKKGLVEAQNEFRKLTQVRSTLEEE